MRDFRPLIEQALDEALPKAATRPSVLSSAVRWAVEGGGKRIRPQVCLAAAEAVGGRAEDALPAACAIEFLHSYTLIHDDLPAMDNDRMRRGKASVWAQFGEAQAILAGDALQALAFGCAARVPHHAAEVVAALSTAAFGVVSGQVEDVATGVGAADRLDFVFRHKTADLFIAAATMGARAVGAAEPCVKALADYACHLGYAFQYVDDLLDAEPGAVPKDFSSLSVLSSGEVRARVAEHTAQACAALAPLPGDASFLDDLVRSLAVRSK